MSAEREIFKDFLKDMEDVIVSWEDKRISPSKAMKEITKLWLNA